MKTRRTVYNPWKRKNIWNEGCWQYNTWQIRREQKANHEPEMGWEERFSQREFRQWMIYISELERSVDAEEGSLLEAITEQFAKGIRAMDEALENAVAEFREARQKAYEETIEKEAEEALEERELAKTTASLKQKNKDLKLVNNATDEDEDKLGIVVEGGGMRGIYAAGVLDVFAEHGLVPNGIIGVSAGAIHGGSYLSGQIGRSIRYYKKYAADPRFMSFRSLLLTGDIVGREFCYDSLPNRLDPMDYDAFNSSPIHFYAAASNAETGESEYLRVEKLPRDMDAIRASASLPYVSRVVEWKGKKLFDGAICDSIPVEAFRNMGYGKNIVILTREVGYEKKPERTLMAKLMYRKYPKFIEAIGKRHEKYNLTLQKIKAWEVDGSVFVIQPKTPLNIGRMEHNAMEIERVYNIGRRDAEHKLEALRDWL